VSTCTCCDHCGHECSHCDEQREHERLDKITNAWNWNKHPIECAQEIIDRDLHWRGDAPDVWASMKRVGYGEREIAAVRDALEVLA
jgi:hypothetical protein